MVSIGRTHSPFRAQSTAVFASSQHRDGLVTLRALVVLRVEHLALTQVWGSPRVRWRVTIRNHVVELRMMRHPGVALESNCSGPA